MKNIKIKLQDKAGSVNVPILLPLISLFALFLGSFIFNQITRQVVLALPWLVIKSIVFVIILIFASRQDLKQMQVSNWYSIALLVVGLIGVSFDSLIGAVVCFSVFFLVAMLTNLGGADVKIAGACGFVLGTLPSLVAMLIGLILSVIIQTAILIFKKHGTKQQFPLVPYLTFGCIVVTILKGLNIL